MFSIFSGLVRRLRWTGSINYITWNSGKKDTQGRNGECHTNVKSVEKRQQIKIEWA